MAGTIRLAWGVLWRALGPFVAAGIGLLFGQVMLLLTLVIATHLAQGDQFETFAYERMDLMPKAQMALDVFYPQHTTATTILLWLPLAAAALVGAACVVLGYRYARQTWRGRTRVVPNLSRVDSIIDAVIDLFSTSTAVRDHERADRGVRDLSKQYGLEVDPDAIVEELPVGMQQRVEIIKMLYRHADILILDEPTAVLTPQEAQALFVTLRAMAAEGRTVVFISHKLHEVKAVADRVTVLRGGRNVATVAAAEATTRELAGMMVGRHVELALQSDLALVRLVEADQDVRERALAGAVLAEERMHLAGSGLEVDCVVREDSGEALRDPVHRHCRPLRGGSG